MTLNRRNFIRGAALTAAAGSFTQGLTMPLTAQNLGIPAAVSSSTAVGTNASVDHSRLKIIGWHQTDAMTTAKGAAHTRIDEELLLKVSSSWRTSWR